MQERPPHEVHSAQGEIADRPHAKMLFAGGAKCSLCRADGRADLGEIEWLVGIRLQKFHEPRENGVVTTVAFPPGRATRSKVAFVPGMSIFSVWRLSRIPAARQEAIILV